MGEINHPSSPFRAFGAPSLSRRKRERRGDQRSRRGGEVGLAHQRLADQEAVDAVGRERIEIGAGRQTAFADKGGVFGCTRRKFDRSVKIDVERLEVTVVYADQARLELERAIELVAVVDLDQHVHAALDRGGFDLGHQAVVERGDRSEEHTSELQSLMRISYAVFCLKKKQNATR